MYKITSGSKITAAIDPAKFGSRNGYLNACAQLEPERSGKKRL